MPERLVPCQRPALCGVQNHRAGTIARCQTSGSAWSGRLQSLAAMPSLSSQSKTESGELAALRRVSDLDALKFRGGLRRSGIRFADSKSDNGRWMDIPYPSEDGSTKSLHLPYSEDSKIDGSVLGKHPDFAVWYESATGTTPADPGVTEGSLEDRIDYVKERVYAGEEVTLELEPVQNTRRFLQLNVTHDTDGDLSSDNLLSTHIKTSSGRVVQAWSLGGKPGRYTFADGVTRKDCWIHPIGPQGHEVSSLITSNEYDQLVALNDQSDDIGNWSEIDPDDELSQAERTDVTIRLALQTVDSGK